MEYYTLDRFEGGVAVLVAEEGGSILVPICQLPFGMREGAVLRREGQNFTLDEAAESERRAAANDKLARLLEK